MTQARDRQAYALDDGIAKDRNRRVGARLWCWQSALIIVLLLAVAGVTMSVAPTIAEASQPIPYLYVSTGQGDVSAQGDVSVVNTTTNAVVATVPVGTEPAGLAITPDGAFAYVANSGTDSSVSVIKTFSNEVVATVPVGHTPWAVAITPDGGQAYVANRTGDDVSVISTSTNLVIATVQVGNDPYDLAVTPNGQFVYVANDDGTVSVISTATSTVIDTVPVGFSANGVAITPNGKFAYVSAFNEVVVINTETNAVVKNIGEIYGAYQLAITPNGAKAYVAGSGGFRVIDTATNSVVRTIPEYRGEHVAIMPDGSRAYLGGAFELADVDTSTDSIVGNVIVTSGARDGLAITPPITLAAPPVPNAPGGTPATVKILSGPPRESAEQTATFSFKGVPGGSYECSIDDGAWAPCHSGQSFGPLMPGDHRFQVREKLNGITGPAASYRWTIDLPRACILKVARARVSALAQRGKVRLVIHYKAYKPAQVTVAYALTGGKGNLGLGTASSHFKTAGIYRRGERLDKGSVAKLRATQSMTVRFSIPQAPSSCTRYYTKRLTIPQHPSPGLTTWFQSDSVFAS